jgi:hypothetical protein
MPSSLVFAPAWLGSVIRDGGFFGSSHVDSPIEELLVVRSAEAAADKVPRRLGLGRQTLDILKLD